MPAFSIYIAELVEDDILTPFRIIFTSSLSAEFTIISPSSNVPLIVYEPPEVIVITLLSIETPEPSKVLVSPNVIVASLVFEDSVVACTSTMLSVEVVSAFTVVVTKLVLNEIAVNVEINYLFKINTPFK